MLVLTLISFYLHYRLDLAIHSGRSIHLVLHRYHADREKSIQLCGTIKHAELVTNKLVLKKAARLLALKFGMESYV